MELIGIPYRITVGRGVKDGKVELKPRIGESVEVSIEDAVNEVKKLF
jgi:prolyl-tRNA synthetase